MIKKKIKKEIIADLNKEYAIKLDLNSNHLKKILEGEIPITKRELKDLITLYGRNFHIHLQNIDYEIVFDYSLPTIHKYDLYKLDLSNIEDFEDVFNASLYDGDITKLNFNNLHDLTGIFEGFKFFDKKFNDSKGNLPYIHQDVKDWLKTNEPQIQLIVLNDKINHNSELLEEFLSNNNIDRESHLGQEIVMAYLKVNDKLEKEKEEIRKRNDLYVNVLIADMYDRDR